MQLTFPNGEHASVAFDHGEISIGSRAGQGVSLPGKSLAPHHASLVADRRVPPALHLSFGERLRVLLAWAFVLAALGWSTTLLPLLPVLALYAAAVAANANLFALFGRSNGWAFALAALLFHQFHYVYTSAAFLACRLGWSPDRQPAPQGVAARPAARPDGAKPP